MHRTGRRVRSAAPAWLHPDHSLDPEREQVSSTASCTMAAVSTRSSSRRVGLPLPSTSRQPPKAWARCDVHHSLLPPAARRGRTVDYTRGWISSASKPPRCAACATMALRLGNAMVIRQPTHGHATCARRATTSSIMTQTVSSCAKITTRGHTSGDTFGMAKTASVVACGFGRCPSPSGLFVSRSGHHTALYYPLAHGSRDTERGQRTDTSLTCAGRAAPGRAAAPRGFSGSDLSLSETDSIYICITLPGPATGGPSLVSTQL